MVSSFHVEATSKLLKLNARVVVSAVAKIGVTFFPESQLEDKLELSSPMNHSEQLSAMLQMGTNLAPLLQRDRPLWSAWMHSSARCRAVDINFDDDDVKLLTNAMILMFDEADLAVQVAVLSLIAKGYQNPDHGHILQIALRHHTGVPTILLNASIHRRIPKTTLTETRENVESSILPILVESEETLGFWGFSDSKFVAKMDSNGMCHVIFESECYALKNKKITSLIPFMEAETRMRFNPLNVAFPDSGKQCTCTPSQVPDDAIEILKAAVSAVSNIDSDRVRHGTGHAQDDVFRVRSRGAMRVPDLVIWPSSEAEVSNVVDLAIKMRLCIIPYGGGTNVSQATRCPSLQIEPRPIVSLDMSKMNKLLGVDEINGLAHVEAGITGRQLENELARLGFTVGHEPDSIEFSTLGGWIATKASGMKRNKYGNIEDIVKSVRIAGRDGVLSHGLGTGVCAWGRESSGFDLLSLALGSEGCLGVITSAIVRIWPVAAVKEYDSLLLRDFGEGTRAMREISKHVTCMPVSVRLLDNAHYRLGMALRPGPSSIISSMVKSFAGEMILWSAGFDQSSVVCVTVAYEGTAEEVRAQKRLITRIVARHGGVRLGPTVGKAAYDMTFMIAYIRDFAMTYHFLSESFESFVPWSQIEAVVTKTKERVCQEHALRCLPGKPFVGCRVTQIYHEGACVYFYFCMSFEGVENASTVYAEIEHAARSEILLHGGSVSHHHGVGKIRSSFLKEINSAPWQATMQSIKKGIDPDNIFGARNGPFSSL